MERHPFGVRGSSKLEVIPRLGSQDATRGAVGATGAHNRSHLLQKGNAVEGSDPQFLPVQIPDAENQEDQGRGVTEQNLIWLAHWSICIEAGREQVRGLLTLTTGADGERQRGHSRTLIRPSVSSPPALIGPLIL